jgi:NAD(P)H-flavin reductase
MSEQKQVGKTKAVSLVYDAESGEQVLLLEHLQEFIDVSRVAFYELTPRDDGSVELRLFDKRKKPIKPRGQ